MNTEDKNLDKISKILKVLGNPIRLKIVVALLERKCRVGKLTDCINEELPIISQQIAILRKADIIEGEREKNVIKYKIKDNFTLQLIELVIEHKMK